VRDGVMLPAPDVAVRPFGMAPIRPRRPAPPAQHVPQIDRSVGLSKDERARHERVLVRFRVVLGPGRSLRPGDVTRVLDEAPELGDGHRVPVDREALDRYLAHRLLFGVEAVGAHPESAARKRDHVLVLCRGRANPANTAAQSSLMLTTVQPLLSASSSACSDPAVYANSR